MGEAEHPRVSGSMDFPGGPVATPTAPQVERPQVVARPQSEAARQLVDPLSRPYVLPSRGLYYDGKLPGGQVIISPTRGAQEEILAGAQGNDTIALPALRHVAEQCISTGGLPFNDLLLFDFSAVMFHFLALSNGTDVLKLSPVHKGGCGQSFPVSMPIMDLSCTNLRVAEPGEAVTWPPTSDDEMASILREMDREMGVDQSQGGEVDLVLPADAVQEPFPTEPLPHTGDIISWRYHRVADLVRAEDFVARTNGGAGQLHTFLMASQLVALNGRPFTGLLEASAWIKRQPSPVLKGLRRQIDHRNFGFDVEPRFRCPHCGGYFKRRLPLDGSVFREGSGS